MSETTFARRWAVHTLGGDESISESQSRLALLRELTEEGLLVSPEKHEAGVILAEQRKGEPSLDRYPHLRAARLRALEADLEDFSRSFYQLQPQFRRRRWEWLAQESREFPELIERLNLWRSALEMEYVAPAHADELERGLIADLAALVPQTPANRAAMRSALVRTFREKERFHLDLVRFGARFPQWAALAPEVADLVRAAKAPASAPPRAAVAHKQSGGSNWMRVLGAIFAVKLCLFVIAAIIGPREKTPITPTFKNYKDPPSRITISSEEVKRMSPELKRVLGVKEEPLPKTNSGNIPAVPIPSSQPPFPVDDFQKRPSAIPQRPNNNRPNIPDRPSIPSNPATSPRSPNQRFSPPSSVPRSPGAGPSSAPGPRFP